MLNKLPFWGQLVVFAALGVGIVAGGQYFYPNFAAMSAKNSGKQTELDELNVKIQEGQQAAKMRAELQAETDRLNVQLASLRRILPTEPEAGALIKWLESQAGRFNLNIKALSEASIKREDFFKEYAYNMEIVGNYHDLGRFLDVIGKHDRILNVRSMGIHANSGPDRLQKSIGASFTAATFVYVEQPAEEGGAS
ncbi:MAG TPA: type 4a pilus biogenesis protein PilO [Patescibacteria group bacterium]|jgi:type IV pilus assembly protein PilO|nr:type 4a pilus biogenesis protein PilO [Patescibacteria group bacterium]